MTNSWAYEAFMKYASKYDASNGMINLKIVHTKAVADVMERITRMLGLSEHIKELAHACAMFHDIGRFEQVKRYGTFLDHLSVNHAELGCEVLISEGLLKGLPHEDAKKVLTAVRNHNAYAIEEGLDEETLLLCRLIRDSDKCDIFRVFACEDMVDTMGETYEQVSEETVTPEVMACFFEHRCIPKKVRKTGLDIWVGFLAFFFDLNFTESIKIIKEDGYYKKPFERIRFKDPDTEKRVSEIINELERYISERLTYDSLH